MTLALGSITLMPGQGSQPTAGHRDVQQDKVRPMLPIQVERLTGVLGLKDGQAPRLEQHGVESSRVGRVIGDQNRGSWGCVWRDRGDTGIGVCTGVLHCEVARLVTGPEVTACRSRGRCEEDNDVPDE